MSLTARVLIALCVGLAIGVAVATLAPQALPATLAIADPIGALFVNAIRMTVVPLVIAGLVSGVASAPDTQSIGRVGKRAVPVAIVILCVGALFGILLGVPILARLPIGIGGTGGLTGGALAPAPAPQNFSQWLVDLIPTNPVKAAADGNMLPLIIFSLMFALALVRLPAERRATVVAFFSGLFDAMLVLVRWVLVLAPLGVLGLSVALGARTGASAATVVVSYVIVVSIASVLFGVIVLYPAAVFIGRMPLERFVRGVAPAQAVAFSSRSSLAALPAMIDGAATTLALPREISHFFLPVAASTFRAGAGVALTVGALFLARLYGIALGPMQLASIGLTVVVTSFSVPGIPGGSIVAMVPVLLAGHIPVEGVGLLLALDTIPDMFRTTINVTGSMVAATIVAPPAAQVARDGALDAA